MGCSPELSPTDYAVMRLQVAFSGRDAQTLPAPYTVLVSLLSKELPCSCRARGILRKWVGTIHASIPQILTENLLCSRLWVKHLR